MDEKRFRVRQNSRPSANGRTFRTVRTDYLGVHNRDTIGAANHGPEKVNQTSATVIKKRKLPLKLMTFSSLGVIILAATGLLIWKIYFHTNKKVNAGPADPFNAKLIASLKFPVYYPSELPRGFIFNKSSIDEPQPNVLTFNLIGPGNYKLFFSEVAFPSSYNIGGYTKKFYDVKNINYNGNNIAVGLLGPVVIGSWNNSSTWIIANSSTITNISTSDVTSALEGLKLSY